MSLFVGTDTGKIYLYDVKKGKVTHRQGESKFDCSIVGCEVLSNVTILSYLERRLLYEEEWRYCCF